MVRLFSRRGGPEKPTDAKKAAEGSGPTGTNSKEPHPLNSKMGQLVDQRVPENGDLIECFPDTRIV